MYEDSIYDSLAAALFLSTFVQFQPEMLGSLSVNVLNSSSLREKKKSCLFNTEA